MKGIARIAMVTAAVLVLAGLAAPVAEACCTPCDPWCKVHLGPKDYCCTGIPEPGNACGLTTCGEYLGGPLPDLEPAEDVADRTAQAAPLLFLDEVQATAPTECGESKPLFLAD